MLGSKTQRSHIRSSLEQVWYQRKSISKIFISWVSGVRGSQWWITRGGREVNWNCNVLNAFLSRKKPSIPKSSSTLQTGNSSLSFNSFEFSLNYNLINLSNLSKILITNQNFGAHRTQVLGLQVCCFLCWLSLKQSLVSCIAMQH